MKTPTILASLAGLALLAGCRTTSAPGEALATDYAPTDAESEVAYWHKLPERLVVTNDEGLHGLIIIADGEDNTRSWDERLALAREKGYVSPGFDDGPNVSMTRGTLATAIAHIIKIKGGVMLNVFGPTGRYATRELVYLNILPADSTEYQSISGLEYIGVISKVQDYQSVGRARPMR